jgi:ATP-dependent protease ClpP protease subunit
MQKDLLLENDIQNLKIPNNHLENYSAHQNNTQNNNTQTRSYNGTSNHNISNNISGNGNTQPNRCPKHTSGNSYPQDRAGDDNSRGDKGENTQEQQENEKVVKENEDLKDKKISEYGQTVLENGKREHKIHLLSIIGEIEGHECLPQHNKTTKYEHVLPQLAAIEDSTEIDGLLILINTVGGDVEAGLAIAEMIASLSKPTVSLVLGGSHSIGVPLAVSANYSYIVPSATMIIHPVRVNGTVIGLTQTFEYFKKRQDRIINFVITHSKIDYNSFRDLMLDTHQLAKDVGSILVGEETVKKGIIDSVGGIKEALSKINEMIDAREEERR